MKSTLFCSNCDKTLCSVSYTEGSGDKLKAWALCPYCGDKSFPSYIYGNFVPEPTPETKVIDMDYRFEKKEVVFHVKCIVR